MNNRPISLLISPSMVFEKLLWNSRTDFFNEKNLFTLVQFGFCSKYSCVHAISEITDFIDRIYKKLMFQVCLIDLKKAFDSSYLYQLFQNLHNCGFRGPILDIVEDYLTDRWQYVFGREPLTEKLPDITGVPQGSKLGSFSLLIQIINLLGASSRFRSGKRF